MCFCLLTLSLQVFFIGWHIANGKNDFLNGVLMKITKNRYLASFTVIVLLLAIMRLLFPSVAENRAVSSILVADSSHVTCRHSNTTFGITVAHPDIGSSATSVFRLASFYDEEGKAVKNRINSVLGFSRTFPDNNDVQLYEANRHGVKPVEDRKDAESRKKELVYIGASPYYHVDPLRSSVPYLVPRAAVLLNDIGRAYYDSLQIKGIPLHQIIVTSVLRSREDVRKLRGHNGNATENSCHLYGTTFDICYNRYKTVDDRNGRKLRAVRNDTLKWVLSEVLRDMREKECCYIKYEVKQGCFHITVR